MISIGIDVSKGKSTVFAANEDGTVFIGSAEYEHTAQDMGRLAEQVCLLPGEVKVLMESTGHYHWPIVSKLLEHQIFVSIVNPLTINHFSKRSVRPGKTDKKDAVTICRYGLAYWNESKPCSPSAKEYSKLQTLSRQHYCYTALKVKLKVNLSELLDKVFPDIQKLLQDAQGRSKLSEFVTTYWHADLVSGQTEEAFCQAYVTWAKEKGYRRNESKAREIYAVSQNGIPTLPCTEATKLLVQTAAAALQEIETAVDIILAQMDRIASTLPEYTTVIAMKGVGKNICSRLIAEIGDVSRFHNAHALVAYTGIDAAPYQSGQYERPHNHISKRGNKYLRKIGFEIMSSLMSNKPTEDNAVYQFMVKKRSEGKHYLSSYMVGLNKFLRIYYARVKPIILQSQNN